MKIEFEGDFEDLYKLFPQMEKNAQRYGKELNPNATVLTVRDILNAKDYLQTFCRLTRRGNGCGACWFADDTGKYCFFKTFYPYEWNKDVKELSELKGEDSNE